MFSWLVMGICTSGFIVWMLYRFGNWKKKKDTRIPPGTVCLYQVGRGPHAPSISPFPVKLETFLRMAKIPYVNDHSHTFSSKGKTPWMMYNGHVIEDSQLCIDYLKKEMCGLDVNKGLTDEEISVARAFRAMVEENLYWTMCHETFVCNPSSLDSLLKDLMPSWMIWGFKKYVGFKIRKQLWGHGIGRHKDADIWDIATKDLRALSVFLGCKPFLLGDTPREIDCTVFGMLSMTVWQMESSRHVDFITHELPNLVRYCERMKDRFWPDWEQRIVGDKFVDDEGKIYTF